jgi:branched-chain amino acid aminotransferase
MAKLRLAETAWVDGEFVEAARATVPLMTHSLHYGLAVFEGIRCYRGADGGRYIFRLREHLRRLYDSAKMCLLDIGPTPEELSRACVEVVHRSSLEACYLRPLAWFGDGEMGLGAVNPTHVAVLAWEWGPYLGEEALRRGVRAKISSFPRLPVHAHLPKGKITGQYVNSILAKREALLAGYDEAILLDGQGFVAEATGENLFCVRDGVLLTPPASSSPILAGVTRDTLLRLARDAGYVVEERAFTRDFLYVADEVFCCGTAAELTPVREVDGRIVGGGGPGPITRALQAAYFRAVRGEDPRYREWLTPADSALDRPRAPF